MNAFSVSGDAVGTYDRYPRYLDGPFAVCWEAPTPDGNFVVARYACQEHAEEVAKQFNLDSPSVPGCGYYVRELVHVKREGGWLTNLLDRLFGSL